MFLHVGKAGGGTVKARLRHYWHVRAIRHCHPRPCPSLLPWRVEDREDGRWNASSKAIEGRSSSNNNGSSSAEKWRRRQQTPPSSPLLLNVRDPVDRFVSAFNWRTKPFCIPYGHERREPLPRGVTYKNFVFAKNENAPNLETHCLPRNRSSSMYDLVYGRYRGNADKMARALCDGENETGIIISDDGNNNNTNGAPSPGTNRTRRVVALKDMNRITYSRY